MDAYLVPASIQTFELEIKRSRFITTVARISGRTKGKQFVQKTRETYPTASHHCWAYIAGIPNDAHQYDQSDDGEPKGTAGKPILNVLTHSGLGNTIVIVTRYFGGIKLGAGGLVRAYTQSVSEALKQLQTTEKQITSPLTIRFPYTYQGTLDNYLAAASITIMSRSFDSDVSYALAVPVSLVESTQLDLSNLTQGQIKITT